MTVRRSVGRTRSGAGRLVSTGAAPPPPFRDLTVVRALVAAATGVGRLAIQLIDFDRSRCMVGAMLRRPRLRNSFKDYLLCDAGRSRRCRGGGDGTTHALSSRNQLACDSAITLDIAGRTTTHIYDALKPSIPSTCPVLSSLPLPALDVDHGRPALPLLFAAQMPPRVLALPHARPVRIERIRELHKVGKLGIQLAQLGRRERVLLGPVRAALVRRHNGREVGQEALVPDRLAVWLVLDNADVGRAPAVCGAEPDVVAVDKADLDREVYPLAVRVGIFLLEPGVDGLERRGCQVVRNRPLGRVLGVL